jgi:hypothetical protein
MEIMTPSTEPITEGQIGKLNQNITARLLKRKKELPSNIFQQVLGDETLLDEFVASILKRIDAISNMIIRTVKVNRNRSAKEALSATGRTQYVSDSVVKAMPNGTAEEVEVYFFKIGRFVSMTDLEKEYELRGLQAVDPFTLAAINEADPAFADEKPNGTQWKDAKGKWCYAIFGRGDDERDLNVYRNGLDWSDRWWFAGSRKTVLVS